MLTKEKYLSSLSRIPFSKVNIEGLGDVGLRLLRSGEAEDCQDKDLDYQISFVLIDANGARIFSDDDIELVKKEMPLAHKVAIMKKLHEVNGLTVPQEEVKKN